MVITRSPKNKQLIGENNKSLNNRVLSEVDLNDSILVIDLYYYSAFIDSKLKYNSSFGQKWSALVAGQNDPTALQAVDYIFDPILKIKRLVKVKSVILLCNSIDKMSNTEKELYKVFSTVTEFSLECTPKTKVNTLYSLAVTYKDRYLILSDDIDFWAICSEKSDIHHCLIAKNNNIRLYSGKFGLEYLSSLIGTNKLINKLRLNKLKYVNLQYLFLLLLYTKFKYAKPGEDLDLSDPSFLGSKGKALEYLSQSHKEISYCFLTKQDMVDIFLTSSGTHFTLNLSRLLKITQFDINLMSSFSNYYARHSVKNIKIEKIPSGKVYYKLVERSKLYCFQDVQIVRANPKKTLPKNLPEPDIANMDTSTAVDQILGNLAW
jgi:hypothetical protein